MIKVNLEQHSEAWYEIRCGRITGTRFKDLMSGDSTKGYSDLILDLAGEIITGEQEETYSNANMERGTELEPEARQEYESIFGPVEQVGFILMDEGTKYHDWVGISPDGLTTEGGLEIKCPLRKTHMSYIEKDVMPNDYKWQVQGSLFVSGLPYWDFMSYYPGMKPFITRVYPDAEMHYKIQMELDKIIPLVNEKLKNYNKYEFIQEETK